MNRTRRASRTGHDQPVTVRYFGMDPSDAVTAKAMDDVQRLHKHYPDLRACHVRVQLDHKHQHQGRPFSVVIDATLTDFELSVNRVHKEDVYVALRDAFDAMQHQIAHVVSRRRGDVKAHGEQAPKRMPGSAAGH